MESDEEELSNKKFLGKIVKPTDVNIHATILIIEAKKCYKGKLWEPKIWVKENYPQKNLKIYRNTSKFRRINKPDCY